MNFDAGFKKVPLDYATTNSMNSGVQPNVQNTEESNCLFSGVETDCPGVNHSIIIPWQPFDINRDVDSQNLDSLKAFFGLPADAEVDMSKVSTRRDGQITDFYVDGKRYSLRYDSDGNINKVLEMEFDENGNVTNQKIRNYDKNGSLENTINYEYTSDGGQTRTARHARYGNPSSLIYQFFREQIALTPPIPYISTDLNHVFENVSYDSQGRVTDFYVGEKKYSLRYDSEGNLAKTLELEFDENGNVSNQKIRNYEPDGSLKNTINYEYINDGKTTGQIRTAEHARYGDPLTMMNKFFGGINYSMNIQNFENIQYDSEGKITDFYLDGKKYSIRYNKNGKPEKTITQTFHENGNVATQSIKKVHDLGFSIINSQNDKYTYDEQGNQTSHKSWFFKFPVEYIN